MTIEREATRHAALEAQGIVVRCACRPCHDRVVNHVREHYVHSRAEVAAAERTRAPQVNETRLRVSRTG